MLYRSLDKTGSNFSISATYDFDKISFSLRNFFDPEFFFDQNVDQFVKQNMK